MISGGDVAQQGGVIAGGDVTQVEDDGIITDDGDVIQVEDDGIVGGGDVADDGGSFSYDESFNEDSNFTEGEESPIIGEADDIDID